MQNILTIDVGTTSVKAALFGPELDALAESGREYTLLTPQDAHVELPGRRIAEPDDIASSGLALIKKYMD